MVQASKMPKRNPVSKPGPGKKKNQMNQEEFDSPASSGSVSKKEYDAALAITELASSSFSNQDADKTRENNTECVNTNTQDHSEIGHGVTTGATVPSGETPPETLNSVTVGEEKILRIRGKKRSGKTGKEKKRAGVVSHTPSIRNSKALERESLAVPVHDHNSLVQTNHEFGNVPANVDNSEGNVPVTNNSKVSVQLGNEDLEMHNFGSSNGGKPKENENKHDPMLMSLPIKKRKYIPDKSPPGCQTEDLSSLRRAEVSKPKRGRPPKENRKINEGKKPRLDTHERSVSKAPTGALTSTEGAQSQHLTGAVNMLSQVRGQHTLPVVDIQTLLTQYPHLAPQIMPQLQKQLLQQTQQTPQYGNVPEVVKALSHPNPPSPPGLGTMIPSMVESQTTTPTTKAPEKLFPSSGEKAGLKPEDRTGINREGSPEYGSITVNVPLQAGPIKPLVTPGGITLHPVAVKDGIVVFRNLREKRTSPGLVPIQPAPPRVPSPVANVQVLQEIEMATRPDEDGDYPIHIAVAQGEIDIIIRLMQAMRAVNLSVDVTDANKQTPLHTAVIDNQQEIVRLLLSHGARSHLRDSRGNGAIHLAVKNGSVGSLQVILQHMSNRDTINLKNSDGFTPLHLSVLKGSKEMVEMLLTAGVDINARDGKSGRTALHHACESNSQKIVELLLQSKADPNIRNYAGDTPISAASGRNYMQIVGLLVKHGADTSQKNSLPDMATVIKGSSPVVTQKLLDKVKASRSASPSTPPAQTSTAAPSLKLSLPTAAELAALTSSLAPLDTPDTPGTPQSPMGPPAMTRIDPVIQSLLLQQQQQFSSVSPAIRPLDMVRLQMAARHGAGNSPRIMSPHPFSVGTPVLGSPLISDQRPALSNTAALIHNFQMLQQQLQQASSDSKLTEKQLLQHRQAIQLTQARLAAAVAEAQGLHSPRTPIHSSPTPLKQSEEKKVVLDLQTSDKQKHEELLQALRRGIEANQAQDKKPNMEELQRKTSPHIPEQAKLNSPIKYLSDYPEGDIQVKKEQKSEDISVKKARGRKSKAGIKKESDSPNATSVCGRSQEDAAMVVEESKAEMVQQEATNLIKYPRKEHSLYMDDDLPTDLSVPKVKKADNNKNTKRITGDLKTEVYKTPNRDTDGKQVLEVNNSDSETGGRISPVNKLVLSDKEGKIQQAEIGKDSENSEKYSYLCAERKHETTAADMSVNVSKTMEQTTDRNVRVASSLELSDKGKQINENKVVSSKTEISSENKVADTVSDVSENVKCLTVPALSESTSPMSPTTSPLRMSRENAVFHSRLMSVSDKVRPVPGLPSRTKPVIMSCNMPVRSSVSEEQSKYVTKDYSKPQEETDFTSRKVVVVSAESSVETVTTQRMTVTDSITSEVTKAVGAKVENSNKISDKTENIQKNLQTLGSDATSTSTNTNPTDVRRPTGLGLNPGGSNIDNIISNVARGMQDTPRPGAFQFLKLSTLPLTPTGSGITSPISDSGDGKDFKMSEAYRRGFLHASQLVAGESLKSVNLDTRVGGENDGDDKSSEKDTKMDTEDVINKEKEGSSDTETDDGELEICMSDDDDNDKL